MLSISPTLVLRGHQVVANVPANSLALSESLQCKCSLDQVTRHNVAYLCDPAPSTITIGEAMHSCLSFAMRQEDEEISLQELSQPPLAHLKDRAERELPQDMC